ncbi:predicted protein [Phaeodactylum tricornutum CCAP 1055/1]|uniref:Leishmanolysin-like peptidase n=1 Tax=Phaeodactylum tricornutum (strain CCAP 1055/1) TaxID=556484 RepID=B7FNU6_PHATC|nr:predicted protein [Phaeodactylum tricornutum CCAP 1055/1]EEC51060.1 predicted protein [Phaeodactylum tricornutum CCAP 1055/1]|eukprot:XP_002176597.1 predicted protein [Phaeodactylum tricornutum CCAP 1055/1]
MRAWIVLGLSTLTCTNAVLGLRNTEPVSTTASNRERMHVVRRLYGSHARDVRNVLDEVETRMQRYQTGFNVDPEHVVPYENHPFEEMKHRNLQDDGSETSTTDTVNNSTSRFRNMRIRFETKALDDMRDATNAAKIDWYKNLVLPVTAQFWSQALQVVPVAGRLRISAGDLESRTYCGDSEFTAVPTSHVTEGLDNTDLVLYVSGSPSSRFCPDRTLAVAVPCNFDQWDRPTAGAINVCLDNIELNPDGTATSEVKQDYVDVTIHEVAHVLGHSSNSYRFFWDPETGTPRTTRPFSPRTVTCVNGEERTGIYPGETTMGFFERNGQRYATIVTPKVRAIARNQFDCQSLEGGQLENQPTRSESCTGDHWDERLFYPEAMSGIISPTTNILSSLTLALMEDSGWYKANYTSSRMSPWGLGVGCDFVNKPCIVQGRNGPTLPDHALGFFCNTEGQKSCSSELTHKMACTIVDYSKESPQELPPKENQYFPNAPGKGGPRQGDYCPVFGSTYDNKDTSELDCTNAGNNGAALNFYGERYGDDSQCIPSSSGEGRCYVTKCVRNPKVLEVNVGGKWLTCVSDYQRIDTGIIGTNIPQTLICPRISQACPDLFCPFNCAGRGTCNYTNRVNGTVQPKCECFDPDDTSEACSDSLIPEGDFLDDSSGLFDNLEENFFDPLLVVFIDHPNKWTGASWAWATGLITMCLILLLCICSSFMPQRKSKAKIYR